MEKESYFKMLKLRPYIDEVTWQREALLDEELQKQKKQLIAAGTSSGKSVYITMDLELFYMNPANKNKKTLFIPSGQSNLRLNIQETFEFFKPTFTYAIAKNGKELEELLKSDIQVVVSLPQSTARHINSLPKIHRFILDEAHTWYFQKTIKSLIKQCKPNQQTLLTGTPAPFILRGGFYSYFVPVMDLYDEGRISDTEVHVITSTYDFKNSEYNANENLTLTPRVKKIITSEEAFKKVVLGMIKKLNNPIKGLKNINRLTNDVAGKFFNHIGKTIIWVGSIQQANKFAEIARTFTGLENAVLVSHSKNDDDSELMEKFKKDKDIKILISVNRGRMGWSYKELFNAVDFTMTRNLSSILQMLARLFRVSETNPSQKKFFYKVSNAKDSGYYTIIMKAVLLLLDREWYSKFNGKNFNGMEIPVTVPRRKRPKTNQVRPGRPKTNYKYELLDLPLDLNFFKSVYAKQDDEFSTVAWTTIGKVRNALKMTQEHFCTNEELIAEARKYKTHTDMTKSDVVTMERIRNRNIGDQAYSHMLDYVFRSNKDNKDFIIAKLLEYKKKYNNPDHDTFCKLSSEVPGRSSYSPMWFVQRAKALGIDHKELLEWTRYKTLEERMKTVKKYSDYATWREENYGDYGWFARRNKLLEVRNLFGLGEYNKSVSLEDSLKDLRKYTSYTEFRLNNKTAYGRLVRTKQTHLAKEYFKNNQ